MVAVRASAGEYIRDKQTGAESIEPTQPITTIQKFNGNLLKFNLFWEQFEEHVHRRSDIANSIKFLCMISVLSGAARSPVEGLPVTSGNCSKARDILKE
ncbi:hypothetical protein T05_3436 [Trichinella murrelli]|uniref:Uncharacterized protein n=1 Tax=Trichinella murrelli TaxID=144512 RepID=A0A0V0T677_9BILA|nr:hypothetical protein T05_3436 [Trichinella murrelli]